MKKRNGCIELGRFVAVVLIMIHHLYFMGAKDYVFHGAMSCVEYFFMVSGYFTMKHMKENYEGVMELKSFPVKYSFQKIFKLIPYLILGEGIYISYVIANYHFTLKESFRYLLYIPLQILCLPMFGIMPNKKFSIGEYQVGAVEPINYWFFGVILVVLPIVIIVIHYLGKYVELELWLGLVCYGMLFCKWGTASIIYSSNGEWFHAGILRGLGGLFLGTSIYRISNEIYSNTIKAKIMLTIIELFSYMGAILLMAYTYNTYTMVIILFFFIALSITLSGKSYSVQISGKLPQYLGKISAPMLCIHVPIYYWVNLLVQKSLLYKAIIAFILTMVLSIICVCIVEKIKGIKNREE